jgi:ElaB/YqjD/DUF883 family membrane-anchored ribosome-binding protein
MDTTPDPLNSVGAVIGEEANRKLDELIAQGPKLAEIAKDVINSAKKCARLTDQYVHDNSWKAAGIGAALGLIVGLLLRRHSNSATLC